MNKDDKVLDFAFMLDIVLIVSTDNGFNVWHRECFRESKVVCKFGKDLTSLVQACAMSS